MGSQIVKGHFCFMLVIFLALIFALPGKVFSKTSHEDRILNIKMSLTATLVIEGAQLRSSKTRTLVLALRQTCHVTMDKLTSVGGRFSHL